MGGLAHLELYTLDFSSGKDGRFTLEFALGIRNKACWDQASDEGGDIARQREAVIAPLAALHRSRRRLNDETAAAPGLRPSHVYALPFSSLERFFGHQNSTN